MDADTDSGEVEAVRRRCAALHRRISGEPLPPSKISPHCTHSLLRLLDSELRFLSRQPPPSPPLSHNVGYLEALAAVLLHPSVRHVSRLRGPHVSCTVGRSPAWILVSAQGPAQRGLQTRVGRALASARSAAALAPYALFLVFAAGIDDYPARNLGDEFGAVDAHHVFDGLPQKARVFEIKVNSGEVDEKVGVFGDVGDPLPQKDRIFEIEAADSDDLVERDGVPDVTGVLEGGGEVVGLKDNAFGRLVSSMGAREGEELEMVNFDTTALIAIVSGISNGGTERLIKAPEVEMRRRFKGNYEFVMAQVKSELHCPILKELEAVIAGKRGIICEYAQSEFKELVSMCGGPSEKLRADQLLKHLLVVPDRPSARIMNLRTTRKIALKNKIVFGTGDCWRSPTLTANMGFVRAISQIDQPRWSNSPQVPPSPFHFRQRGSQTSP